MDDQVKVSFLKERIKEHYEITPYSFRPRIAKKMTQPTHIDLGQGILDTIYDIYKEINNNAGNTAICLPEHIQSAE